MSFDIALWRREAASRWPRGGISRSSSPRTRPWWRRTQRARTYAPFATGLSSDAAILYLGNYITVGAAEDPHGSTSATPERVRRSIELHLELHSEKPRRVQLQPLRRDRLSIPKHALRRVWNRKPLQSPSERYPDERWLPCHTRWKRNSSQAGAMLLRENLMAEQPYHLSVAARPRDQIPIYIFALAQN